MKTPWEKFVKDTENNPYNDFDAFQRWLKGDDVFANIDGLAMAPRLYHKFNEVLNAFIIKGQYIISPYGDFEAFECSECGAATVIADDPKEQPNYCFKCGVKFDWEGVYEEILNNHYKEME